jgi:hypothetical protein
MIQLIVVLVVIGFLLYVVQAFIPMDARFKQLIGAIAILCAVLYVLRFFGVV